MADKDISIAIKTAADLAAVKQAETALDGLEAQARQTDAALDAVAGSAGTGGGAAGRGKGAAAAIKELAEEAPKAAAGSRALGSAATQVGFQVQDFAVQVGGGTNALTAFAQQGSQLLGLFGPGGAIAGALLAVGAVAFKVFESTKEGGELSAEAAAELAAELEKAVKEAARLNDEFGQDSAEAFIGALEREAEEYRKINTEVEANIELMRARRRAQAEVESERAALELLKIDRDPNLTEEQKIRARGQVQEGTEARRVAERLAEIGERVAKAEAAVADARAAVPAAEGPRDKALRQIEEERQAADALRARVAEADKAKSQGVAEAESALNVLLSKVGSRTNPLDPRSGAASPEEEAAIEAARQRLEEQRRIAGSVTDEERGRLNRLEGPEGTSGSIAALVKGLADLQKAVEDAQAAANTAGTNRDQTAAIAAEEIGGITSAFALSRERRGLATTGAAADAAARAEERRLAEERRRREEIQREGERAGGIADQAANAAGRGGFQVDAALIERLGNAVEARPTSGGVGELQRVLRSLAETLEGTRAEEARRYREMVADLEKVKAKLKTIGDGK
jgi:hypothetical protein